MRERFAHAASDKGPIGCPALELALEKTVEINTASSPLACARESASGECADPVNSPVFPQARS